MQFKKTILVVDDNGSNRLLPGLILRPLGFTVLECASGREAIEVLAKVTVAGVLLDLAMPGLSGLEVLRVIRADPLHKHLRVIAYTHCLDNADVAGLTAQGFDGVLLKPLKSINLLKIVAN